MSASPLELAQVAKAAALELGFDACGITDLAPIERSAALDAWLAARYHGEMKYMARQAGKRRDPQLAWTEAKSVVVVLHTYSSTGRYGDHGCRIASYAQGDDYHQVTADLLRGLGAKLTESAGRGSCKYYVDAGPLPERELATRAGIGWIGKNTMLINPKIGSLTFIGCLLTDLELAPDAPFEADRCGTCTRCLDACPTEAFVAPRVLDARRCISYLTIEARSEIPDHLRAAVGDNLFGCDICQDVCPWNVSFAQQTREPRFQPPPAAERPSPEEILALDDAGFNRIFGHTALERAGLAGLQRNARVVIENRAAGAKA